MCKGHFPQHGIPEAGCRGKSKGHTCIGSDVWDEFETLVLGETQFQGQIIEYFICSSLKSNIVMSALSNHSHSIC